MGVVSFACVTVESAIVAGCCVTGSRVDGVCVLMVEVKVVVAADWGFVLSALLSLILYCLISCS